MNSNIKFETCETCREWDNTFCEDDCNIEGLCERTGNITYNDYFCERHKLKLAIRIKRLYYKIKTIFYNSIPDPLKECNKAKARECVHIDGFLCPCEEMNKNNKED